MKIKRIISAVAVLIASMCLMAGAVSFTDIEGHWAYDQIVEYAEKGIVNGYPDGTFKPDEQVTREQFCKIMLNSFEFAGVDRETASFSDVSPDSWSYEFVEGASKYLPGYEDGTYVPEAAARRDDVTAAIVKIMGYPEGVVAGKGGSLSFTDGASINAELLDYVGLAVENGIVNGFPEGSFKPEAGITRAEAVTLISRAVSKYNEEAFTWEAASAYLEAVYPKEEIDTQTIITVNGKSVSVAEYRYYYRRYSDTFNYYFGSNWRNDPELTQLFDDCVNYDVAVSGVIRGFVDEYGLKLSLAEMNEYIFSKYNLFYEFHGEQLPEHLESLHATPYYMLENCLAYAFKYSAIDYLYGVGGVHYEELASVFEKDYVRAKHVLVLTEGKVSKEAAYAIAETVYEKAVAGEDFDTLIAQYNEDPGMQSNPDGYVFTYGYMVEPFEKATYALEVGAISEIVETEYGYHVIQRLPLDAETIVNSEAFTNTVNTVFDELLAEKTEGAQIVEADNYNELLMIILEEAGVTVEEPEDETPEEIDVATASAEEIVNAINAIKAPEFMYGVIPVDITDADALKMFTGLDSAEGIKDVAACESMMGSQAFSLVVVKLEDAAKAKDVAEAMKSGIDQRKWICVEADDIKVSAKGDTVMLIMIDSAYRESISVEDVTEAFKTVCGGTLDFEL